MEEASQLAMICDGMRGRKAGVGEDRDLRIPVSSSCGISVILVCGGGDEVK